MSNTEYLDEIDVLIERNNIPDCSVGVKTNIPTTEDFGYTTFQTDTTEPPIGFVDLNDVIGFGTEVLSLRRERDELSAKLAEIQSELIALKTRIDFLLRIA